jgi:hypothetical protein
MNSGQAPRIALCAIAMARWLLRATHEDWGEAMRAEFYVDAFYGRPSLRWALGCLEAATRIRLAHTDHRYLVAALAMVGILLYVEWHADGDAVVLALLIGTAAILGFFRPQRAKLTRLFVGESLLVAHASTTATGWWLPFYQFAPLNWDDWVIVASVGIPALVSAIVGATYRRRLDVVS